MTREELIKKVALKMDEISSSDDVQVPVVESDNNPLYTQINYLLNESVNDVLMKAPIFRIQKQIATIKEYKEKELFNKTRKAVVFAIPNNFLRLVSITDSIFQRPIVDLALEGDDIDKRQHNKFLVAKYAKPIAIIGQGSTGKTITCYSYDIDYAPNPSLNYIKRYEQDLDYFSDTNLDGYLTDIVSWLCAGKVFAAQGDVNKGKICDENAAALMI